MALALAEAGYEVYAIGRSEVALEQLRAALPGITPIAVDVTDREALEAVVTGLHIDVLINNAGVMPSLGNFAEMKISDIDATLEVNLSAAIVLTRLVVPQMCAREAGHILFTGSSAAHAPFPNIAVYSAAKAALSGFAASLRADLSPYGIRVTEIVPQSWSRARKEGAQWITKRPDADNLAKILADAMNKIVYVDDAKVASLIVQKRYGEFCRVTVSVIDLEGAA